MGKAITYDKILSEAELCANRMGIPVLLDSEKASANWEYTQGKFPELIKRIKQHLGRVKTPAKHGFSHLEYVASNAPSIAEIELQAQGLSSQEIIDRTIILGLLHDIERWRGYQEEHCIEGAKVADEILAELGMSDEYIHELIVIHDDGDFNPRNDLNFDIPHVSTYDVDHFLWFTGMKDIYWLERREKGQDPREAIKQSNFLYDYQDCLRSTYGKSRKDELVRVGIGIVEHIRKTFGVE